MTTLRNENIVCVALPAWEGDYMKSTVQLMTRLAESNNVLYVDYPRTWTDVLKGFVGKSTAPLARMFGFKGRLSSGGAKAPKRLKVLTLPPVFPVNSLPEGVLRTLGLKFNGWLISRSIRKAMIELSMSTPIVVNAFQPGLGLAMKGRLDEKLLVYYCYDEISQAAWCKRHGAREEKSFLREVDVTITTSDALWEAKEKYSNQCFVVKNGVDFHLFEQIASLKDQNAASTSNGRKVAGFVGSIDSRVDIDLIEAVCRRTPGWRFDFVGPVRDKEAGKRLEALGNVRMLGPCAPDDLPSVMRHFDAGIIPFRKDDFTRYIYPIKVNEYLAAGLPVVMTSFARIPELQAAVSFADDADSFANELEIAVRQTSREEKLSRQGFAMLNSWSARAAQFSRIVSGIHTPSRAA